MANFDDLRNRLPPPQRKVMGATLADGQGAPGAPPPLPPAHARARAATKTGLAPPAPGSAPEPPPAASPPPAPASQAPEPPRSVTPPGTRLVANPYDPPTITRRAKEAAERTGDHLEDPPQSEAGARGYLVEQPWWRTAKGVAVAVPVIVAGLTALGPALVIPVIRAIREPWEGAKVSDIAEAKAAAKQAQDALELEKKARQAKDDEAAEKRAEDVKRLDEVSARVPAVKPNPNRPPK